MTEWMLKTQNYIVVLFYVLALSTKIHKKLCKAWREEKRTEWS